MCIRDSLMVGKLVLCNTLAEYEVHSAADELRPVKVASGHEFLITESVEQILSLIHICD